MIDLTVRSVREWGNVSHHITRKTYPGDNDYMAAGKSYCIVLATGSVLLLLPFFVIQILPFQDYPNHLARMYVLGHIADSATLQEYYQVSWEPIPNLAMDLIIPRMMLLFPVETAGKVFCAFILLSTAPAVTLLHYALHKKLSLWPLLSMLFVYNSILVLGFLNYLLGLNLALAASALWILSRDRRAVYSIPVFSAVAMVLYFVHLAALGVYALIVFGHEISVDLESRRRHAGKHKIPWPAALLQFAPPLALFISSSPTFHINLGSAGLLSVWFKIQGIYSIFDSGNRPIDVPYFLLFATMAVAAVSLRAISFHARAGVAFWMLTGAFLAMPEVLFGSAYASYRLAIAVVLFAMAASDLRPANRWLIGSAAAIVSVLFLLRTAVIVEEWRGFKEEHRQVLEAARVIQEGSRVLPYVVQENSNDFFMKPPILHLATLAVVYRRAFVPTLFTDPAKQPLRISDKYQRLSWKWPRQDLSGDLFSKSLDDPENPLHESLVGEFDYVWLFSLPPQRFTEPASFQKVAVGEKFTLYRVK